MSLYQELRINPPKLEVVENAREVVMNLVSVMCDNKYEIKFKKNTELDFKLNTGIQAYSNFQIPCSKSDLEWLADDNKWAEVFSMINEGTALIEKCRSR